jgi:hypothetical protein
MVNPEIDKALQSAYSLPYETSLMIVQLGQERLKALQASGAALDARTTQAAAIQLAAAAFAAGLVSAREISIITAFLGFLACVAFVVGAGIAFYGMYSCKTQVAGIEPSWWFPARSESDFDNRDALSWAAATTQDMIDFTRNVDERRAEFLNFSLMHGIGGGVLVSTAAFARFWAF